MNRAEQGRHTRSVIISTAAKLVHKNGFRATSMNDIITEVGLTKGALLHHFKTKMDLGYAIADEYLYHYVYDRWVQPLENSNNPISTMIELIDSIFSSYNLEAINLGCPITNLATEMSPIDEGFRVRIQRIYDIQVAGICDALRKGKENGVVRKDIDVEEVAYLYISVISGSRSIAKNAKNKVALIKPMKAITAYLESLRP